MKNYIYNAQLIDNQGLNRGAIDDDDLHRFTYLLGKLIVDSDGKGSYTITVNKQPNF